MDDCRRVVFSMFAVIVILLLLSNCCTIGRALASNKDLTGKKLHNYGEIHEAKSLIDALSSKLYLNLETYKSKYENLKQRSNEYLKRSGSMQNEIKVLNKLKGLLNDLTKVNLICEKFYINFDFTVSRKIIINSTVALSKDSTVSVAVNHRDLIDRELALSNGNDLRVYFIKDEDCQTREIDRIVENIATKKTTVSFKLQEDLLKTASDGSAYYLIYGNKNAGKAKDNPENVYLFYDDFSDSSFEKNWQKQWGSISVEKGLLKVRTDNTPTGDYSEISVFVKHGHDWKDIEVELDFNEKNNKAYPGPFVRVQDPRIQSTTAWWFEYGTSGSPCTMRPYKNNKDGSWLYRCTLTKPLSAGSWTHTKLRVVGDRFSHWVNNHIIQNNVQVASTWFINKGTFGLGCHKNRGANKCDTSYDNIKITKYIPVMPTVSLGAECKVDLRKFHGLGASAKNPATSCKQIHDISLHGGKHRLKNGVYWIKTSADSSAPTYCDLANGGWTLIGKVGGLVNQLYKVWLIKNFNVDALGSPTLLSKVGCIDARYLATYHASTIMFSSGENRNGIGSKWVRWALPEGRETGSLWRHSVGRSAVSRAKMYPVTVTAWNGAEKVCYQNKYGIMPLPPHGGSYPSASYNRAGNTAVRDYCMAIGVQKQGRSADGWTQNGNGYDSPRSNSDWPNSKYNHQSPYVTVWLK